MAIISAIEPQKSTLNKKNKRFNIFIDQKYAFSTNEENLLKYKLKSGLSLKEEEVNKISKDEFFSYLTDAAVNFLSYRPRTEKEITNYLIKKISTKQNISFKDAKESAVISQVITKLKKYKYINDEEFVNWWIKSRNNSKQKGIRLIKMELVQKGIDKKLIEKIASSEKNQLGLALKALEKRKARWQKIDSKQLKSKVLYYLGSRGFEMETIKEAFAIFFEKS